MEYKKSFRRVRLRKNGVECAGGGKGEDELGGAEI